MYHEDGTLKKLGFQLLVPETKKNTEHQRYYDQEPMGTFELSLTNGTKFDSIFNPWTSQESDAKKFSIKSAPNWSFYLTNVTDQVTLYLAPTKLHHLAPPCTILHHLAPPCTT